MYTPALFAVPEIERAQVLMRSYPFAVIVSSGPDGMVASHLPLMVRTEPTPKGSLRGHMARANPHWRGLDGREVLVIFNGAHAYVSPSFYANPDENVPTWSYAAVHAYGRVRTFDDREELGALLGEQVEGFEAHLARPWRLESVAERVERRVAAIIGFEIAIDRLEAKMKIGQNRDRDDRVSAAAALAARSDEGSRQIAAWMHELGLVGG